MTKKKEQKRRRLRGGVLFAISLLLIGSATLRLALEAGPALARDSSGQEQDLSQPEPRAGQPAGSSQKELQALIFALQKREQDLKLREREFEDRKKALSIAEGAIDTRLAALQSAEDALKSTLAMADVASEEDLEKLTNVYEKMKPKQAAALFEEMDPEFAAGFLSRMRPDAAASIMAGLSPMAAYTISVVLAGRNASVPTQ